MLERTKSCEGVRTAIPTMRSPDSLEFGETEVTVEDIMTEAIISAAPEEAVLSAAQRMSEHNISCIAVTTGERAVGILTERDVLKGVAAGYEEFVGATVAEKMSSPVISVPPDLRALEAALGGRLQDIVVESWHDAEASKRAEAEEKLRSRKTP